MTVTIGGSEYSVARSRLGAFLRLQVAAQALEEATELRHSRRMSDAMLACLRVCIPELEKEAFEAAPWYETIGAYLSVQLLNVLPNAEQFAIMRIQAGEAKSVPWDFDGRMVATWIHMIAAAYHWSKEEIENLWPEEAVGFIQEILVDEFRDQEFIYSLSDRAWTTDQGSKTMRYVQFPKPAWMHPTPESLRQPVRMVKSMMPVGIVISEEGQESVH